MTDPIEVKALVVNFFKKLFFDDLISKHATEPIDPSLGLTAEQASNLSKLYTSNEVWNALKSMSPFKTPELDGFQALFFQRCWGLVGTTVIRTVFDILNVRSSPENLNHTFLRLIPKAENPQYITQFRPMGLCNVTYKLVTKVIVERLKEVL